MVEKGYLTKSSEDRVKVFSSSSESENAHLNYRMACDVGSFVPFGDFAEPVTNQLKQNLFSYVKKYDKSKQIKKCNEEFGEMNLSACLSELWNASSQSYPIPQQYLWANICTDVVLSLINHNDCDATSVDSCPMIQDELFHDFDMHRLCKDVKPDEAVERELIQTADEVIEEIDGILQFDQVETVKGNTCEDHTVALTFGGELEDFDEFIDNASFHLYHDAVMLDKTDNERCKTLKQMAISEIDDELKDLEESVKSLSENLLVELNMRDELIYEKEIRNAFITKILEVQYKQEQLKQGSKNLVAGRGISRFGKLTKSFSMNDTSELATGRYLTTLIPYDNVSPPSLENLQVLIRLLDAIKQDSSDVPALITDYILNVLCPAPTPSRLLKF